MALLACFKKAQKIHDAVVTEKTQTRLYCPECGAHRHGKIMKKDLTNGGSKYMTGKIKVDGKTVKYSRKCRCPSCEKTFVKAKIGYKSIWIYVLEKADVARFPDAKGKGSGCRYLKLVGEQAKARAQNAANKISGFRRSLRRSKNKLAEIKKK